MFQLTIGEKAPDPSDWIHKLAELVTAVMPVSWPLLIATLAWLFRQPIGDLIRRVRHAEMPGGLKADVGEQMDALEASAVRASEKDPETAATTRAVVGEVVSKLPYASPQETVVRAWIEVERAIDKVPEVAEIRGFSNKTYFLLTHGLIDHSDYNVLNRLQALRNTVMGSSVDTNVQQAEQYAHSAGLMVAILGRLTESKPDKPNESASG